MRSAIGASAGYRRISAERVCRQAGYVTLMTLGQMPEALIIGWLRNQRLLMSVSDIEEVTVDWETTPPPFILKAACDKRWVSQR